MENLQAPHPSPKKVSRRACKRYLGRGCSKQEDKGREGAEGGRNVYSSRTLELRGQLSPSDNSYCSNKVAAASSRGGNSSPKAVLVTHTHTPAPSDRGQRGEGHVCPNPCHIVKYNPRFVWFATVNRVKGSRDTSQWTGTASFIYRLLIISKKSAPRSPIKLGKFRRCVGFFWFGNAEILIEDDNRSCGDCDIVRFENGPLFGGSINRRFNFGEISSTIRGFRRMGDLLISSVMSCFLYICEIL